MRDAVAASDPRFVCRREGHKPAVTITAISPTPGSGRYSYSTTCQRCGKWIDVEVKV